MTELLDKVLKRVDALSATEQDAIAAHILDTLESDAAWERTFQANRERCLDLADDALQEHLRGETQPTEELLVE